MGDMADYARECELDAFENSAPAYMRRLTPGRSQGLLRRLFGTPARKNRDTIWFQRDGTPIKLADMGDGHLLNTIALLGRKAEAWQKTYALAKSMELRIPEPIMYGQPLEFWSNAMLKELNRREKAKS